MLFQPTDKKSKHYGSIHTFKQYRLAIQDDILTLDFQESTVSVRVHLV